MNIGIVDYCHFHGKQKGAIGSTFLRVDNLIEKDKDFHYWTQGAKFDALIFQKVYWKYMMDVYEGPKILDLCDADWLKGEKQGGVDIVDIGQKVDAITCSSPALAEAVKVFVKHIPVIHIADRLNFDICPDPKKHTEQAKTVVWFGYSGNANMVLEDYVLEAIANQGLKLIVVSDKGFTPKMSVVGQYGPLEIENIKYEYQTAYYEIQRGDIAINPKWQSLPFKYKSNNKTIISWRLGLPVAEGGEELTKYISPEARQDEVDKRVKEVEANYNIEKSAIQYKEIICQIQNQKNTSLKDQSTKK